METLSPSPTKMIVKGHFSTEDYCKGKQESDERTLKMLGREAK